jgi:hypothetical protein
MPTNTYVALDKKTVATAVASVEFTSIPSTYTDLVIVANYGTSTAGPLSFQIGNGSVDTGANYSRTCVYGAGSTPLSFRETGQTYFNTGNGQTTIETIGTTHFMNYSNTTTYKTILDRSNSRTGTVAMNAYLWRSFSAINTIKIYNSNGYNLLAGCTFSLYGIRAEAGGSTPKATGGVVTTDATYWYHTFTSSGNFVPNQTLSCDYLVVAGGGGGAGGGIGNGGGGGAGGLLTGTAMSLTSGAKIVLVGAGGFGLDNPSNGNNSILFGSSTITAYGGGNGAGYEQNGNAGGCGGGGGQMGVSGTTGGAGTQGFAGGSVSGIGAAGGGGMGAVGQNCTSPTGGNGGIGITNSIIGTSTYYSGGGGGSSHNNSTTQSSGGNGGGGAGGYRTAA